MRPAEPRRQHALATLRHREFRLLWGGQLVSTIGDQLQVVAIAWHVYVLSGSALQLGLVGAARAIPYLLLSLVGGAAADTMDRKRLLLITQGLQIVTAAWLVLETMSGSVSVVTLYIVTFITSASQAFDGPARQALIPNVVPAEELSSAYTLTTLLRHMATVVGPGIGGLLIASVGLGWTYAANGISFVALMGALLAMGPVQREQSSGATTWALVTGGLRYAVGQPLVLWPLVIDLFTRALGSPRGLLPIFAKDVFAAGPQGLGWLNAALSGGAVIGGLVLGARGNVKRPVPMMLTAYSFEALAVVALGLAPWLAAHGCAAVRVDCPGAGPALWIALLALFCNGIGNIMGEVPRTTMVQLSTPDELRGRVSALASMFSAGGPQLGQLDTGVMASGLGATGAAVVGGFGAFLSVMVFGLPLLRHRDASGAGIQPARAVSGRP